MIDPSVVYSPGDWVALSRADGWALIEVPVTDPRVHALWESLDRSADQLLDELLKTGVSSLPGFVAVRREQGGVRCLVRRPATLIIESTSGSEMCEGANPWQDVVIAPLPIGVTLSVSGLSRGVELPTVTGIVPAGRLTVRFLPSAVDEQGDLSVSGAATTSESSIVETVVTSVPPSAPAGIPPASAPNAPVAATPPVPAPEREPTATPKSTYHQLLNLDSINLQTFLAERRSEEQESAGEEVAALEQPAPTTSTPANAKPLPRTDVTATWSDAELEVDAPGPPEARQTASKSPGSVGAVIDGVPWANGPTAGSGADQSAVQNLALPSATPKIVEAAQQERAPNVSAPLNSEEIMAVTTSRAALLRPLAEAVPSGPTVLALHCLRGHPSPPSAVTCRICKAQLDTSQDPVQIVRPNLGVLKFSNDLIVPLDRSVVFGRDPRPINDNPAERPNLIRPIESGELSRMHASVTIEGWQLVLRDLDSANGTFLTPPGGVTEQIRVQEDYQLEPGSEVSLGEIVSFLYEPAP
jgi:FHA domain